MQREEIDYQEDDAIFAHGTTCRIRQGMNTPAALASSQVNIENVKKSRPVILHCSQSRDF